MFLVKKSYLGLGMAMRMMSPHLALPTVPTPEASAISPTLRGLVKWSITFSEYMAFPPSFSWK